jgi:hypothetical protein
MVDDPKTILRLAGHFSDPTYTFTQRSFHERKSEEFFDRNAKKMKKTLRNE